MAKGEKKGSFKKKIMYIVIIGSVIVAVFCGRKKLKAAWDKLKNFKRK